MSDSLTNDPKLDCAPPGTTREQQIDVLERLHDIHRKMHAGKAYGFEQTILCDTVREVERLRAALVASVEVIQVWHNMEIPKKERSTLWDIYWRNAPEMKPIREALSALERVEK